MLAGQKSRWTWIAVMLGTAFVGGCIALLAGWKLALNESEKHLREYASEFLQQDEKIAQNIDTTLARANASQFEPCSDGDLGLLRQLLFESPYLKDVGRINESALLCSAMAGRLPKPVVRIARDVTTYRGRQIYYNVDLLFAKGHTAEVVADGRANVVVSPDVFSDFSRPPMLFAGAIVNREQHKILQMYSSSLTTMPLDVMLANRLVERDGNIYYPQCSATRPDCVLTALPMAEIWKPYYSTLMGFFAVGMVIGGVLAAICWGMTRRQTSTASQLRRAIKRKRLWMVYQPIVDVESGRICSCEALVRWMDESGKMVRPDIFVALAEEHGFIGTLTTFVLERVVTEMGDLLRNDDGFRVTVNLSAADLMDETFLPRLDALLQAKTIPARTIGLELTERSTANNKVAVKAIHALRERGHVVLIDDFGTGYSSLSYLHELSVNALKIDRAFTNTIGTESVTASIVPQIIAMADTLKLKVVVEGVERADQVEYLSKLKPGLQAQGWFFGKGIPAAEMRLKLSKQPQAVEFA